MHWINEYIGKEWGLGCVGPDRFDCLGLVREIQDKKYGIKIPEISVDSERLISVIRAMKGHDAWLEWIRIDSPEDGCLVKLYRQAEPDHIGVWVDADGGGILHSSRKNGVQFDRPFALMAMGWERIEYYRRRVD
jgi:hypothetical protein